MRSQDTFYVFDVELGRRFLGKREWTRYDFFFEKNEFLSFSRALFIFFLAPGVFGISF